MIETIPFKINGKIFNRQLVECYSRVVGFLRPINQWNDSKVAEFFYKKNFSIKKAMGSS